MACESPGRPLDCAASVARSPGWDGRSTSETCTAAAGGVSPTTVECATEGSTEPGSVAVGAGTSARVVDAVARGAAEASTASAAAGTTSFTNGRKSGSNQSAGTAG